MKKYLIGFIVGIMVMVSSNAIASVGETVTAIFANFNYVVNGESKTLDEPVLVHNGNSYLRTTQIVNMLGYDVTYKSDSRTIEFSKPETTEPTQSPTETVTPPVSDNPSQTPSKPTTDAVDAPKDTTVDTPTVTPAETPTENTSDTPPPETPTPETPPTPTPDNTAMCQGIRDSYSLQIFNVDNTKPNGWAWTITQLQSSRDSALSAAGC